MFEKINTKELKKDIAEAGMNIGIVAMSAAMVIGLADNASVRRPVLVTVNSGLSPIGEQGGVNNDFRSQREDEGPHSVSYGVQRNSPPRSGRL